jgi:hypothetical protein
MSELTFNSDEINRRRTHLPFVCSIALQFGADIETIRKALCRDSLGKANGPLGVALDLIAGPSA